MKNHRPLASLVYILTLIATAAATSSNTASSSSTTYTVTMRVASTGTIYFNPGGTYYKATMVAMEVLS